MKVKYLAKRGTVYQFSRRVPDDVRPVIGEDHWRWSLKTDSLTDAEKVSRKHTVETQEIIDEVRAGTYRLFTNDELDDLALQWSLFFQTSYEANIAYELFPQHVPEGQPINSTESSKIFATRAELQVSVQEWATQLDRMPEIGSNDWEKLIDVCLDAYLVANPALSNEAAIILEEQGFCKEGIKHGSIRVVSRPEKVLTRNKLSNVFKEFVESDPDLAENTLLEYKLSVDRFVELHGELDVTEISRSHVEKFRNALRKLPTRPPNNIREKPIDEQILWAQENDAKSVKGGATLG